jgi:hypothetical protein
VAVFAPAPGSVWQTEVGPNWNGSNPLGESGILRRRSDALFSGKLNTPSTSDSAKAVVRRNTEEVEGNGRLTNCSQMIWSITRRSRNNSRQVWRAQALHVDVASVS